MMKKSLLWSLLGSLTLASSAWALPLGNEPVTIGGSPSGFIEQTGAVVDTGESSCRYTMRWTNNGGGNAQVCRLLEAQADGNLNCSSNHLIKFNTAILGGSFLTGLRCRGNDPNDVTQPVLALIAGESEAGPGLGVSGVVLMDQFFDNITF